MKENPNPITMLLGVLTIIAAFTVSRALSQSLPSTVCMKVNLNTFNDSYFKVDVFDPLSTTVLDGTHKGWCVVYGDIINLGRDFNAEVYSTLANIPGDWLEGKSNLDSLNYVINQNYVGQSSLNGYGNYTPGDVQVAMWHLLHDGLLLPNTGLNIGPWDENRAQEIVFEALLLGDGFTPSCGENFGIILRPTALCESPEVALPWRTQVVMIEFPVACLGDYVWEDTDKNGVQDDGQTGINGVKVNLLDCNEDPLLNANGQPMTTTTQDDASGNPGYYLFDKLVGGCYIVEFEKDPNVQFSPPDKGDDNSDSDVDPNTGRTGPINLANGQTDLSIDAGCFPVVVDCDGCDGKVTQLTLQYNGNQSATIKVETKKDGSVFDDMLNPGESFTIFGNDDKGTLGTEIMLLVNGVENTKIHTSCSQPIGPGLVAGNFLVLEGYSRNGGLLCPLPLVKPGTKGDDGDKKSKSKKSKGKKGDDDDKKSKGKKGDDDDKMSKGKKSNDDDKKSKGKKSNDDDKKDDCVECKGKVTQLTLQYNGANRAEITVKTKHYGHIYVGWTNPGEIFTIKGNDKNSTLGTEIILKSDSVACAKIHTSCSKPVGPGLEAGPFLVLEGYSREGGLLCDVLESENRTRSVYQPNQSEAELSMYSGFDANEGTSLFITAPPLTEWSLESSKNMNDWQTLQSLEIPATGILELQVVVHEGQSGFFRLIRHPATNGTDRALSTY